MDHFEDYLPLREPTYYILLSLAQSSKHGYAILKDVAALSDDKIRMSNGTLYGAITRLLDQGLITRVDSDEPPTAGKPRKAYKLTPDGHRVLAAEVDRLKSLLKAASLTSVEEAS